jgi:hypothetical protein
MAGRVAFAGSKRPGAVSRTPSLRGLPRATNIILPAFGRRTATLSGRRSATSGRHFCDLGFELGRMEICRSVSGYSGPAPAQNGETNYAVPSIVAWINMRGQRCLSIALGLKGRPTGGFFPWRSPAAALETGRAYGSTTRHEHHTPLLPA